MVELGRPTDTVMSDVVTVGCPPPLSINVCSSSPGRVGSLAMRGSATNVPMPWCREILPARSSSSSARRTEMVLTAAISASSVFDGRRSPGCRSCSETMLSTSSCTCW